MAAKSSSLFIFAAMNAQQQKPAAKAVTEQGTKGEQIHAKEIQKSQLNKPYSKLNAKDSVDTPKKKTTKKKKTKNHS